MEAINIYEAINIIVTNPLPVQAFKPNSTVCSTEMDDAAAVGSGEASRTTQQKNEVREKKLLKHSGETKVPQPPSSLPSYRPHVVMIHSSNGSRTLTGQP